jgi:hypothetical protein
LLLHCQRVEAMAYNKGRSSHYFKLDCFASARAIYAQPSDTSLAASGSLFVGAEIFISLRLFSSGMVVPHLAAKNPVQY